MSEHESHINPDRFADSAGVSWSGRSFEANSWANDDGSANPKLLKAIAQLRAGSGTAEQVLDALRESRVLIPLLANLGESGEGAPGQIVDKSADLAIVTVETPDHQDGLPVFSSVAAMQAWNSDARPVPVFAPKAALAAAQEGNKRIILDPMAESEFVVRNPAIEALAKGAPWVHPVRDERVWQAVKIATGAVPHILDFDIRDPDPHCILSATEIELALVMADGLDREQLLEQMQVFAKALAASSEIAEYVDSLRVSITAPSRTEQAS